MKNIFKAALLLALILMITACSSEDPGSTSITADPPGDSGAQDAAAANDPGELKSPVPDSLDFDGQTVRFYSYYPEIGGNGELDPARATLLEVEPGDVVNDAIYRRNMEVQEKLNVIFEFAYAPPNIDDAFNNNFISRSVNAGMDEYDIVIGRQFQCVQLTTGGVFRNIKNLPHLDINNAWWATRYINDLTIGNDVLMFVTGDISLAWLVRLSTMYFNKELYAANFGDPDDMYRLVLNGGWTLDALDSKAREVYRDLNGDGLANDADQFGLITHAISMTDHFTYASGIRATARDENGLPYFIFNNEKTVNFVQKLHNLYYNNTGTWVVPFSHPQFGPIFNDKFIAGEALFRPDILGNSEALRGAETDFGMIPFPKFDENEPSYLALVHDTAPLFCVPATAAQDELIGAVLEEMAFKGYLHMTPAFFDIALKNKYMRDSSDYAMQCLDLIYQNSTTDFAYVYNYALNDMGLIMRDLMGRRSADFVSQYERLEDRANAALQRIIDAYLN
jgi:hypothetical protein